MKLILSSGVIPIQMITIGIIIIAALLGGKLSKRLHFSEISGYLLGGAIVSPFALKLLGVFPENSIFLYGDALNVFKFFIFVFLSMVAFGIGEELFFEKIIKIGKSAMIICLIQGALTWVTISTAFYFLSNFSLIESMLIGSIGIATAPAVTFVLLNELNVEGRLRHLVGNIVVVDDLIEVIIFSLLVQVIVTSGGEEVGVTTFLPVVYEIFFAMLLGLAVYIFLKIFVRDEKTVTVQPHPDHDELFLDRILTTSPSPSIDILLLVMGATSIAAGIAYYNHWPFLVTSIFAGFLVANFHSHAIFDSLKIDNIAPALNLFFFALIGSTISFAGITKANILLIILYIVTRAFGKIIGTFMGCKIVKEDQKITSFLPLLMLPQAGVAAVEAVFVSTILGKPEFIAIILPAIIFFEVFGVFLVDRSLTRWAKTHGETI